MAGAEAGTALSPGGGAAGTSLAALFTRGEQIATHKNDNVFKELEGRELTAEEQKIIGERVALQRNMANEFDKRERARKARSRLPPSPSRVPQCGGLPAPRTRARAAPPCTPSPPKPGGSPPARPSCERSNPWSRTPPMRRPWPRWRTRAGCAWHAAAGKPLRPLPLTPLNRPPPRSEDEAAIALTDPTYRANLAAYLRPAAPAGAGAPPAPHAAGS